MGSQKVYKVLFKGRILPGFDKESVIENVFNITRIPKETITRKFFSGKTVVIRRADTQEYASRLQKTFAQAGIETYIEEVTETTGVDSESDSQAKETLDWREQQTETEEPDSKSAFFVSKKQAFAFVGLFLLIVIVYMISVSTESPSEHVSSNKSAKTEQAPADSEQLSLVNPRQINHLIKITDKNELSRVFRFLPLLDINTDVLKALTQLKGFNDTISNNNPLYLFSTQKHVGIFFTGQFLVDPGSHGQLQKLLNKLQSKQPCVKSQALNLYQSDRFMLLSSLDKKAKDESQKEQLNKYFSHLNEQFASLLPLSTDTSATFNYFNQIPVTTAVNALTPPSQQPGSPNSFILTADKTQYRFQPTQQFQQSNTELLANLGIEPGQSQLITALPVRNLVDLSLLLISENFPRGMDNVNFKPEHIINIEPSYTTKNISDYNKALDIEFVPQWLSGPFAIVTNNYQFDRQLKIELLAKGQNIENLMEYSQLAKIAVQSAYNAKGEDILEHQCTAPEDSYFNDYDGTQEAYINDDFISYHATTALKTINIKPGNHIEDIDKIVGAITLNLPNKIQFKSIILSEKVNLQKFEQFSLAIQAINDNTINYQLLGNKDYFLTIRAYNKAGAVLKTKSMTPHKLKNNLGFNYLQSFSEPVHSIKIYYATNSELITYPFAFKPQILVPTGSILPEEAELLIFTHSELPVKPLDKNILADNPHWIGSNIAYTEQGPFYISLFSQQGKQSMKVMDNAINSIPDDGSKVSKQDGVVTLKTAHTQYIIQNLTAVNLKLQQGKDILFNDFITFTEKELFSEDTADITSTPAVYLNANTAINFDVEKKNNIQGTVRLSLPTKLKNHSSQFVSPGQNIKLGDILIKPVKITRQQVQFNIIGNINQLVQVQLYNENRQLISQALELKQVAENQALLTLLYYDNIDTIKLVLAESAIKKEYPVAFILP